MSLASNINANFGVRQWETQKLPVTRKASELVLIGRAA